MHSPHESGARAAARAELLEARARAAAMRVRRGLRVRAPSSLPLQPQRPVSSELGASEFGASEFAASDVGPADLGGSGRGRFDDVPAYGAAERGAHASCRNEVRETA